MPAELRRATIADAGLITAMTEAAFEGYRSFAAPGWEPPEQSLAVTAERLGRADAWGVVATAAGALAGVGAFEQARVDRVGAPIDGLAHVWAIFVVPAHWGDGTATALLAAVTAEMRARGFAEGRLYTPAGQARARRFYAREGWVERGGPVPVLELGLDLVELRRAL